MQLLLAMFILIQTCDYLKGKDWVVDQGIVTQQHVTLKHPLTDVKQFRCCMHHVFFFVLTLQGGVAGKLVSRLLTVFALVLSRKLTRGCRESSFYCLESPGGKPNSWKINRKHEPPKKKKKRFILSPDLCDHSNPAHALPFTDRALLPATTLKNL